MIKTKNADKHCIYKLITNDIINSLQQSIPLSTVHSSTIAKVIFEYLYNFKDPYIAWNVQKQLLLYINCNNFKWIALKPGAIINRIELTKHTTSIFLKNHQIIKIFPCCVYHKAGNKAEKQCINNSIKSDWIIHGLFTKCICLMNSKMDR